MVKITKQIKKSSIKPVFSKSKLKHIAYLGFPFVLVAVLLAGIKLGSVKGLTAVVWVTSTSVFYLDFLFTEKLPALKSFQSYIRLLLNEVPALLQIITFAGFMAYFYRSNTQASFAISLLTALLVCMYLTFRWRRFLKDDGYTDKIIDSYDKDFRVFTFVLYWILILFLLKATDLLLKQ